MPIATEAAKRLYPDPVLLRGLLASGGAALAFGVVWAVAITFGAGADSVYDSIRILGLLGVLAWVAGGSSGLAYARTGGRPWIGGVALGIALGIPLFVAWTDMHGVAGCG